MNDQSKFRRFFFGGTLLSAMVLFFLTCATNKIIATDQKPWDHFLSIMDEKCRNGLIVFFDEINKHDYCKYDSDCSRLGNGLIGCYVLVNKAFHDEYSKKTDVLTEMCYSQVDITGSCVRKEVVCSSNGRCTTSAK